MSPLHASWAAAMAVAAQSAGGRLWVAAAAKAKPSLAAVTAAAAMLVGGARGKGGGRGLRAVVQLGPARVRRGAAAGAVRWSAGALAGLGLRWPELGLEGEGAGRPHEVH